MNLISFKAQSDSVAAREASSLLNILYNYSSLWTYLPCVGCCRLCGLREFMIVICSGLHEQLCEYTRAYKYNDY